ncbi:MAG TPA: protein tyrosine phosphatase [Roseiflexaceae bacterium]|nr:protein tyrosine phosphatase [Roseiflexaceae bacterium]
MASILVIGGADTGRAPITAALLQQHLTRQGHAAIVGSAGVLGHDGDPAEVEARDTMTHMGLSIDDHRARSLDEHLANSAAVLLALDNGAALVARARFPDAADRVHTLGSLAGRQRDIPDPFRMQIGAWITYAREIDGLLEAALPNILSQLPDGEHATQTQAPSIGAPTAIDPARTAAVERMGRLLKTAADMPDVIDWSSARQRISADLDTVAALTSASADLAPAYVGLLRAALSITPSAPSPGQLAALHAALSPLGQPVAQGELDQLSAQLGNWLNL